VHEYPRATCVRAALLVVVTAVAFVATGAVACPLLRSQDVILGLGLLGLIALVELVESLSADPGRRWMTSLAGALGVGASIILGPLLGGLVVALAHTVDGLTVRRESIKTVVNAASNGLAALGSGLIYLTLTHPPMTLASALPPVLAAVTAAMGGLLINVGTLAPIVAPVLGVSGRQVVPLIASPVLAHALMLAVGGASAALLPSPMMEPRFVLFALLLAPYLAAVDLRLARNPVT
jgi:hypothetical protein